MWYCGVSLAHSPVARAAATVLSVQGNTGPRWEEKEAKAFWRGRDARRERLELVRLARGHEDVLDVGLTHLFFFRNEEDITAETLVTPTPFYQFFKVSDLSLRLYPLYYMIICYILKNIPCGLCIDKDNKAYQSINQSINQNLTHALQSHKV